MQTEVDPKNILITLAVAEFSEELHGIARPIVEAVIPRVFRGMASPRQEDLDTLARVLEIARSRANHFQRNEPFLVSIFRYQRETRTNLYEFSPVRFFDGRGNPHHVMLRNALGIVTLAWQIVRFPDHLILDEEAFVVAYNIQKPQSS